MKKLIIRVLICLLCCICLYMGNYPVKAATVLTENREGRDGEYTCLHGTGLFPDAADRSVTTKVRQKVYNIDIKRRKYLK